MGVARAVAADAVLAEAGRAFAAAAAELAVRLGAARRRTARARAVAGRAGVHSRGGIRSPARRAGTCRRCSAGCTSGTGRCRRSRSRRRRRRTGRHCVPSVHAAPFARLHPPEPRSRRRPCRRHRIAARRPRMRVAAASPASSVPPSPPSSRARAAALAGFATAGQSSIASGTLSPSPSAGTSASSCSANLPRGTPESPACRRRRAPRPTKPRACTRSPPWRRARLDQHRAEAGRALGHQRAARGHARVLPQRARRRRRRRRAARRASSRPRPTDSSSSTAPARAASSCRTRLAATSNTGRERAGASVIGRGRMRPGQRRRVARDRHGLSSCRPSRGRPPSPRRPRPRRRSRPTATSAGAAARAGGAGAARVPTATERGRGRAARRGGRHAAAGSRPRPRRPAGCLAPVSRSRPSISAIIDLHLRHQRRIGRDQHELLIAWRAPSSDRPAAAGTARR